MIAQAQIIDVRSHPRGRFGIHRGTEAGVGLLMRPRVVHVVAEQYREGRVVLIDPPLHLAKPRGDVARGVAVGSKLKSRGIAGLEPSAECALILSDDDIGPRVPHAIFVIGAPIEPRDARRMHDAILDIRRNVSIECCCLPRCCTHHAILNGERVLSPRAGGNRLPQNVDAIEIAARISSQGRVARLQSRVLIDGELRIGGNHERLQEGIEPDTERVSDGRQQYWRSEYLP